MLVEFVSNAKVYISEILAGIQRVVGQRATSGVRNKGIAHVASDHAT